VYSFATYINEAGNRNPIDYLKLNFPLVLNTMKNYKNSYFFNIRNATLKMPHALCIYWPASEQVTGCNYKTTKKKHHHFPMQNKLLKNKNMTMNFQVCFYQNTLWVNQT
jgi:hypothetical protein